MSIDKREFEEIEALEMGRRRKELRLSSASDVRAMFDIDYKCLIFYMIMSFIKDNHIGGASLNVSPCV